MKPERELVIPMVASERPMITRGEVETLSDREAGPDSPVLSVYLDTNLALPVDTNGSQFLEETLKIEAEVERRRELDLVEQVIAAANKKQKAVLGLDENAVRLFRE